MNQKILESYDTSILINPEEANDFFNKGILFAIFKRNFYNEFVKL